MLRKHSIQQFATESAMALRAMKIRMLRSLGSIACLLAAAQSAFAQFQEVNDDDSTRSYTAIVISQNAEVRSGPGREYYATQPMSEGSRVEVYGLRSGWLAIRPPEGSFSWLRADDVQLDATAPASSDYTSGTVLRDGVISQVGSQLTQDRDVWQVQLKQNEQVYVSGEDPANPGWLKIAPPAGEFRWIRASDVRRATAEENSFETSYRPARSGSSTTSRTNRAATDWTGTTVAEQVEKLNQQLTDAVAYAASAEELSELADQAAEALERARDATSRDLAQQLADRAEKFLDIAQRQQQLAQAMTGTNRGSSSAAPSRLHVDAQNIAALPGQQATTAGTDSTRTTPTDSEPRYDATGILTPVNSGNTSVPQYALLDETGNLQYYLTVAPGLRLQTFEGRYIGVTGNRGYSPELNARHVTARQVHALDTPIRRE